MHRSRRVLIRLLCSASTLVAIACGSTTSANAPTAPTGTSAPGADVQVTPGFFDVGHLPLAETGTCVVGSVGTDAISTFITDGQMTVDSSGNFTFPNVAGGYPGTMNLSTGAWSFSGSTVGCMAPGSTRTMSASGKCTSDAACSGTFSQTSSDGGTETGTVAFYR
jgi:hypothetical protein